MKMNKRGQGLSTNAIILIILGVVILVVLIVGFAMGWDTIAPWLSKENVDDVVSGCNVACNMGITGTYSFCSQTRDLIDAEKNEYNDITCYALSVLDETQKYAVGKCDLDCDVRELVSITDLNNDHKIDDKDVTEFCLGNEGKMIHYFLINNKVKTYGTENCPVTIP